MIYLKWLRIFFIFPLLLVSMAGTAQANWEIDSVGLSGKCALVSPELKVDDGQGETRMRLKLNRDQLLVTTKSNIDSTMNDIGLKVDDKDFIFVSQVSETTHVVFSNDRIETIIKQFIAGRQVTIHLRFWPTWPTTGVKKAEFSLIGFTKALKAFAQCE